jgi:hypothetical protein
MPNGQPERQATCYISAHPIPTWPKDRCLIVSQDRSKAGDIAERGCETHVKRTAPGPDPSLLHSNEACDAALHSV